MQCSGPRSQKIVLHLYVDPRGLASFVACQLIALNKSPGVRPIGVGEVFWRVIGKAVLAIITDDIRMVVGTL